MDNFFETRDRIKFRFTLHSLRELQGKASMPFINRNKLVLKYQNLLQIQISSLIASMGIFLFLGFQYELPILFLFLLLSFIGWIVLRLKFKFIRISKSFKLREPPVEQGEILASIQNGKLKFYYVIENKYSYFYLIPIENSVFYKMNLANNKSLIEKDADKALPLKKKKAFNQFYKVTKVSKITENEFSSAS